MAVRVPSEEAGTRAFDTIALRPGGLSRRMWLDASGLTPSQLAGGLDWLRDLFGREPIIKNWEGGEWIYKLAILDRDAQEHVERLLRTQITRVRREYNLLHGISEQHPTVENEYQCELARRRLTDLKYAYGRLAEREQTTA